MKLPIFPNLIWNRLTNLLKNLTNGYANNVISWMEYNFSLRNLKNLTKYVIMGNNFGKAQKIKWKKELVS